MTDKSDDQLFSRRETLRLMGAAGVTTLVGLGDEQLFGLLPTGLSRTAEASLLPSFLQPDLFSAAPISPGIVISAVQAEVAT